MTRASVKFKIGFTITPDILFGIIAKVLPLEDLHIEQIVDAPILDPDIRKFDKVSLAALQLRAERKQHNAAKRKSPKYYKKRPSIPLQLDKGINAIILGLLKLGPRKAVELKGPLLESGFSPNSVGSRLQNLEKHGIVVQMGDGKWCMAKNAITPDMRKVVEEYHNGDEGE